MSIIRLQKTVISVLLADYYSLVSFQILMIPAALLDRQVARNLGQPTDN